MEVVVAQLVASDTTGLWLKSSQQQILYWTFVYCQLSIEKTKKEVENDPLKIKAK